MIGMLDDVSPSPFVPTHWIVTRFERECRERHVYVRLGKVRKGRVNSLNDWADIRVVSQYNTQ